MGRKLDEALAILNGLVGDHLSRTGNALATEMAFFRDGAPLKLSRAALHKALPAPAPRVIVFVHGVLCTEAIWRFPNHPDQDYGTLLERELGFTPLYVRFNSGASIVENGARLARLLDQLVAQYPVALQEIVLVGYSMGGLLVRRACRVAELEKLAWLTYVKRAFYVGTPHLGAPAERLGRAVSKLLRAIDDPYTRIVSEVSDLRSQGIRDLGDSHLHDEKAETRGWSLREPQHPLPLLASIKHHLIAGTLTGDDAIAWLLGDSIVPLTSAAWRTEAPNAALPIEQIKILAGLNHIVLAHHDDVYAQLRSWLEEDR
jgi:pimeloyl-ACP methyl ester carboxylesterase